MAAVNVVFTCTQRKVGGIPLRNHVARFRPRSGDGVDRWVQHLKTSPGGVVPAMDLYCGEHWDTVRSLLGPERRGVCDVWVASAGYGLIPASAPVASYGATFATGDGDTVVDQEDVAGSARAWWRALSTWRGPVPGKPRSLKQLASSAPRTPLIVAAAPSYLRALSADLLDARDALADKDFLVVVTSRTPVVDGLRDHVVFSDVRLRNRFGGSCVSLNARVVVDAVESLPKERLRASVLRPRYEKIISRLEKPMTEERKTVSDEHVREFIRAELKANPNARHSPLLRKLRSEKKLQCEQKRFRSLFVEVKG